MLTGRTTGMEANANGNKAHILIKAMANGPPSLGRAHQRGGRIITVEPLPGLDAVLERRPKSLAQAILNLTSHQFRLGDPGKHGGK